MVTSVIVPKVKVVSNLVKGRDRQRQEDDEFGFIVSPIQQLIEEEHMWEGVFSSGSPSAQASSPRLHYNQMRSEVSADVFYNFGKGWARAICISTAPRLHWHSAGC